MGNKKGLTLVEMVIAVAIIVILGGVVVMGVISAVGNSEERSQIVESKNLDYDQSKDEVEGLLVAPVT